MDRVRDVPEEEDAGKAEVQQAWDDVSGKELDPTRVKQARREEMEYVGKKEVWKKIKRTQAQKEGIKIVGTKWIDIDKGDIHNPIYRSRIVAKEFNDSKTGEGIEGLFASSPPPLKALRLLVSEAATIKNREKGEQVVMVADVSRAFFEGAARRHLC